MGGISRTSLFFKAHRDQNSTSMISFVVVAFFSRQQIVASYYELKISVKLRDIIIFNL